MDPNASRETLDHSIMYIFAVALEDADWHHVKSYSKSRARRKSTIKIWRSIKTWNKPMIVLVNKISASASEIFAGALKDHKRAIILGENSYGKGSVQSIIPLKNKGAIRLTVAKYYLPSGKSISEVGVSPDIEIDEDTDEFRIKTDTDNQLSYALKLLNG